MLGAESYKPYYIAAESHEPYYIAAGPYEPYCIAVKPLGLIRQWEVAGLVPICIVLKILKKKIISYQAKYQQGFKLIVLFLSYF